MKITAIRTFRADEFSNVLWVHVETDAGITGLGETFYGAEAVAAHIHNTLSVRLLGQNPLNIELLHREMVNLPMAQASTGVEYRAASAIDIALWDIFGKVCNQPVWQMLGGQSWDRMRIYNTCAGTRYVRTNVIKPVDTWNLGVSDSPYEDLDGFMNRPAELALNLLENGITAMKIWPFDPHAAEFKGQHISASALKTALKPFEEIRRAVGDKMEIMLEMHSLWNLPTAMAIAREVADFKPLWFEDPIKMNSPQALAEFARATPVMTCASETLGSRFAYKEYLDRDACHVVMADLCWT
ncbi:MAG: mandelate racemase/muconate lactonizing enzyme family protein, partial [Paracoccaceae bacterium]|nr:mandelate racemase/muconate lactonizing enzyme family protein [Paracoccaceae bacterium]